MNPLLQLLGMLILLVPTVLSIVVLVILVRGLLRLQEDLRTVRAELSWRPDENEQAV